MSLKTIELTGQIEVITGLHIGAGNDDIHIGGIDNPVIKDRDGNPYIPGSSLKGKIRSLLEIAEGVMSPDGSPSTTETNPRSKIPVIFGDTTGSSITRVIFRDAFLSEKSKNELVEKSLLPTESKPENTINRLEGKASNPRNTERVIPGLTFDFEIILRILDGDNAEEFKAVIVRGLELLEHDALGGSGSRGYGKIKFSGTNWDGVPFEL